MTVKRILCLTLAAVTAALCFTACTGKDQKADFQFSADQKAMYDHIPQADLDGYNFRILSRKGMVKDQFIEEETGDIISDAIYRRNETVKALLNCEITSIESSSIKADDAINTILAGDDQYDIILPHSRSAFAYAVQNCLINFNDVKTIDLSNDWWSKDIVDSCNINGYLYVLDGDISTHRLHYAFTMYFNKRIFDELGLEYPYQDALNGEWTFDKFAKLVKQGSKDLNGDGIIKQDDDQFGYYTWDTYGPIQVLYTGGQRIYAKDQRGLPKLSLNSPKTVEVYSKYFDLVNSEDVFIQVQQKKMSTGDHFVAGRSMFADRSLGSAKEMRSMSDDFGILPWPKFTKDDEYATAINGHASLMVMPITVSDPDTSGMVIEALSAVGQMEVIPAFYDVSLKTKFSRDYESEAMIDIVKNSLIYDLGYVSGGTLQACGERLAAQSNPDFSAYYAANESRALSDLNNFLRNYAKIG